ncbi:MAG: NAD(P)-dependent oxidoreductase [Myxococcota bacterium]
MKLLVTGSAGLVGRALAQRLWAEGHEVRAFDLIDGNDILDRPALRSAMAGCEGVVHLAAVSRVVWGEDDPERCWTTNVEGTRNVVELAATSPQRPFVLFTSSREVYGEPVSTPVAEDAPLRPLNVYARSKVAGEDLVGQLGERGAVVRLSGVYGDPADHADRVVPAFVRGALAGGTLRVEGSSRAFDFTHLSDVTLALRRLVGRLTAGASVPVLHLVSGQAVSLGELARLAIAIAGRGQTMEAPGRSYDVTRFLGDPARAEATLDWRVSVPLEDGMRTLARAFSAAG